MAPPLRIHNENGEVSLSGRTCVTGSLRRRTACCTAVAVLFALGCFGFTAAAHALECQHSTNFRVGNASPPGSQLATNYGYRVNAGSFSLAGISSSQASIAAIRASDVWNDQSQFGRFTYLGTTGITDLPHDRVDCVAAGTNFSIVTMHDVCWTAHAIAEPRCHDSYGTPTQFNIMLARCGPSYPTAVPWAVGAIGPDELDLVSVLAHEFGHTLGLGHHKDGFGVMTPPTPLNSIVRRELYQADHECAEHNPDLGARTTTGYRRTISGGSVGAETAYLVGANGSPGRSWLANGWSYGWLVSDAAAHWFQSSVEDIPSIDPLTGSAVLATVWREDPAFDRAFYTEHFEWPIGSRYTAAAHHRVRYARSADSFATTSGTGTLSHCSAMSGPWSCSTSTPLQTGHRLAFAFDDYEGRTVTAWAHQNRANNSASNELRITVGQIGHATLPVHNTLGERSAVGPGVACHDNNAGGYACVAAYVDPDDAYGLVRTRRFTPVWNSSLNRYTLSVSSEVVVGTTTASSIAAWRAGDYWWFAVRVAGDGQPMQLWRSTNGSSWTSQGNFGATYVGPTAVSYYVGTSNHLLAWR